VQVCSESNVIQLRERRGTTYYMPAEPGGFRDDEDAGHLALAVWASQLAAEGGALEAIAKG
jgi:hypothetical protein